MEVWGNMKTGEVEELDKVQGGSLKRLLKVGNTTSYMGVLFETGIWPVSYQLSYKRLMLYQNIANSDDERFVKKLLLEEEKFKIEGS